MSDKPGIPPSGLADDLIPVLRDHLRQGSHPERSLIDLAAGLERASIAAAPVPEPAMVQLVTFSLGQEAYGVPIERVLEVIRVGSLTRVPEAPAHVRGVTNVRGRLLPVLDLRTRLGMPAVEPDRHSRIVMVEAHGRRFGLLVDRVSYVFTVAASAVAAFPEGNTRSDTVVGFAEDAGKLVLVVDVDRAVLLPSEERS